MKTRYSAVTVAVLAVFAATGCDDNSQGSLSGRTPDRLPQRGATDDSPPSDPDKAPSATGTPGSTTPVQDPSATGATTPGTGAGTGAGNGTGGGGGGVVAGTGKTAVLNTFSKVWVSGDDKGPTKLGKLTGAGTMDASFAFDATNKAAVSILTHYTRSANQANGNNSYLQGGVAFATLTEKGVVPGPEVALPNLNGDRTWMRPVGGFVSGDRALLIAASEDNGINNNPQPVAFLVSAKSGLVLPQPNNTRGATNITKPTNLIQLALKAGINVNNPNNQRGPHTCVLDETKPDTYICGMQYNNQAQEAFSVTALADNSLKMNWLVRYSNTAQHCRPQVVSLPGTNTFAIAAVEANNQPAEIGYRVSIASKDTGQPSLSKIVVRSEPGKNKYVSEPVLGLINKDKLAITYGMSSSVRQNNDGNGHAGGKKIDAAVLVNIADLTIAGTPTLGVGQYGRHGSSFVTGYGPAGGPALAVISGSSTGTGGGFIQMYPLNSEGLLGVKDAAKVYQVSAFSDVANVQARGKRNPNNQARGFINGLGDVPNPGFTADPAKATLNFMPEVKTFSFSTVTGYSGPEALGKGIKNSVWLSLVPASWQDGLQTMPGKPTDKPGVNDDGTGPAPRSTGIATNPSGDVASAGAGGTNVLPNGENDETRSNEKTRDVAAASDGCSMASGNESSGLGLFGLILAGALVVVRRKRGEA
jgi:MYXO-CTERM domain-containing protein